MKKREKGCAKVALRLYKIYNTVIFFHGDCQKAKVMKNKKRKKKKILQLMKKKRRGTGNEGPEGSETKLNENLDSASELFEIRLFKKKFRPLLANPSCKPTKCKNK